MKIEGKNYRTIWFDKETSEVNIIDQTKLPHKFVIKKKIQAPINAPDILDKMFDIKYFANKPIMITLPQVKNVTSCKPMNKSVKIKQNINAGIYLIPNNAGI